MAQLDLWQAELNALPWQGRNPRSLTRASLGLFLKRERQKDDCFFVDPNQLLLMLAEPKAPWVYQGAPLLLEVKDDLPF